MLDFIWHSVAAQIGIAGALVVGLFAVAWFIPPFRRWAIGAAGVVLAAAAIYAKGARDEKRKWDSDIEKDIAKGRKARADAERELNDGRLRDDKWDRDKG